MCWHITVVEGGGMYDDLWTCVKCGREKYPEVMGGWPWKRVILK